MSESPEIVEDKQPQCTNHNARQQAAGGTRHVDMSERPESVVDKQQQEQSMYYIYIHAYSLME